MFCLLFVIILQLYEIYNIDSMVFYDLHNYDFTVFKYRIFLYNSYNDDFYEKIIMML